VELVIVIPVFNEAGALRGVIREWSDALHATGATASFVMIDDGSTDDSLALLRELQNEYTGITILTQANRGHGHACLSGYQYAIALPAPWVLQVDSDGQCDPRYFQLLWSQRHASAAVYGRRRWREDGVMRNWISAALARIVRWCSGVQVPDPNVPYRLMRQDLLRDTVPAIPAGVELVNVYLSVLQQRRDAVHWVDIVFRKRSAGQSKYRPLRMAALVLGLCRALIRNHSSLLPAPDRHTHESRGP